MDVRKANNKLVFRLFLVSASMFAFGVFAMPPLYDKFCEITGFGQAGVRVADSAPAQTVGNRHVTLLFDATANSALPWSFAPVERRMEVKLGQLSQAHYAVSSLVETATTGRAVYNVTPPEAARYFVKIECFCFSEQVLEARESKELPVRFYIEAGLPEDIKEVTLAYTFFLNQDAGRLTQQTNPGDH